MGLLGCDLVTLRALLLLWALLPPPSSAQKERHRCPLLPDPGLQVEYGPSQDPAMTPCSPPASALQPPSSFLQGDFSSGGEGVLTRMFLP